MRVRQLHIRIEQCATMWIVELCPSYHVRSNECLCSKYLNYIIFIVLIQNYLFNDLIATAIMTLRQRFQCGLCNSIWRKKMLLTGRYAIYSEDIPARLTVNSGIEVPGWNLDLIRAHIGFFSARKPIRNLYRVFFGCVKHPCPHP